ncbi:uncharacterized protein GGS22DRAFT_25018 [Annulohypoxylon maeteangense]|uniref:uncharacterized protein n=1 Tax=Annulohypoxylon maeteangense TaxID=1927788 RepID=UPI0020082E14|nr:uncharacterized protein GGS22DRAFT_25018 [Annulohypoxylon maeteangense]KAI0883725.1 hypothetical protein GGS22DRAFT_25018 [Annulohypoxylon maeteangense]
MRWLSPALAKTFPSPILCCSILALSSKPNVGAFLISSYIAAVSPTLSNFTSLSLPRSLRRFCMPYALVIRETNPNRIRRLRSQLERLPRHWRIFAGRTQDSANILRRLGVLLQVLSKVSSIQNSLKT